ncbi:hypothetical protein FOCC_FOCC016854, partial [Frankliniella occidentalis]
RGEEAPRQRPAQPHRGRRSSQRARAVPTTRTPSRPATHATGEDVAEELLLLRPKKAAAAAAAYRPRHDPQIVRLGGAADAAGGRAVPAPHHPVALQALHGGDRRVAHRGLRVPEPGGAGLGHPDGGLRAQQRGGP